MWGKETAMIELTPEQRQELDAPGPARARDPQTNETYVLVAGGSAVGILHDPIPGVTHDPVVQLLLRGEAQTLHEAEEKYLDAASPEILELLASPLSNRELARHPLLNLMRAQGSRGWEDSLL